MRVEPAALLAKYRWLIVGRRVPQFIRGFRMSGWDSISGRDSNNEDPAAAEAARIIRYCFYPGLPPRANFMAAAARLDPKKYHLHDAA